MRQQDLEQEMRDLGIHRYWKTVERTKQTELETNSPLGRRVLTESVQKLAEEIKDWKKLVTRKPVGQRNSAYEYINMLDASLVAAITARTVIDSISMHRKITKTANTIGKMLEDEVRWREFRSQHPDLWRHNEKQLKKISGYESKRRYIKNSEKYIDLQFDKWSPSVKVKVGMVLLELMRMSTGIIEINTRTGLLGKRETYVQPTEELMKWFKEAHKYAEDLSPMYLPMIESPLDWSGVFFGGYKTEAVAQRPLIKSQDRDHLEELDAMDLVEPVVAVNKLQQTGWRIVNTNFDVLEYCWENDITVGDLPPAEGEPIPSKPHDIATNKESRRKWRKLAASIRYANQANESKRLQVSKVIWIAKKFLPYDVYFPWYMDFRSRMYPKPNFLTPQGPDFARSLLRFKKGKPIITEDHEHSLAIQGANVYGEDKCSLLDRVQWVFKNEDLIKEIAKDPYATTSLWGKADKPWAFLAFCNEWSSYLKEGKGFVSTLPCGIDGASNGLQLYSLLMKDPVGAAATNVLPCDVPRDIYGDVAAKTIERLQSSDEPMAKVWLNFGVTRACCKRPCMVVPYSGTKFSCKNYIIDWFKEELKLRNVENPFGWEELFAPCSFLADHVWDAINDVVGEARKAMTWLQQCSDICMDEGIPIRWTTPTGFLVKQAYETWQRQSIRTVLGDVIRQHRIRVGTGRLDRRRAKNGIAPNYIHSLDSSVGQGAIIKCDARGVEEVNAVHDDFVVPAADIPILRECLLETVVEIFSENLLEKFAQELTRFLPSDIQLPETPQQGDLDINSVRQSLYFFA